MIAGPTVAAALLVAAAARARVAVSSRVASVHISAVATRRTTLRARLIIDGAAAEAGIEAVAKTAPVRRGRATLALGRCSATAGLGADVQGLRCEAVGTLRRERERDREETKGRHLGGAGRNRIEFVEQHEVRSGGVRRSDDGIP